MQVTSTHKEDSSDEEQAVPGLLTLQNSCELEIDLSSQGKQERGRAAAQEDQKEEEKAEPIKSCCEENTDISYSQMTVGQQEEIPLPKDVPMELPVKLKVLSSVWWPHSEVTSLCQRVTLWVWGKNIVIWNQIYPRVLPKNQCHPDILNLMNSLPGDVITPEMALLVLLVITWHHFQSPKRTSGVFRRQGKGTWQSSNCSWHGIP